ncbi:hypothetical protein GGR21_002906 [Dysgonomonas hofstadii]|uniref:Uncharacterized protein n=1 Tax=Dysgonomonas hofstadii TaxID=637886 RepID=A0A840CX24_9BACT|nr:hypothetical protein [Dysgonomonas hofstadii]MBB4036992.1 hypothetical protein [Dysgonomonas hofstadii]
MTNDTRKQSPVELSQLPPIEDPVGFWIFGSKSDSQGNFESGRYEFTRLADYARNLQLERRISITMETDDFEMFIGEEMTIYRIVAKNVKTLYVNGDDIGDFDPDVNLEDITIPKGSVMNIHIERLGTDTKAYLFIHAKAKIEY